MEKKILRLRKRGLSYREIARRMGCSLSTVSYHCGDGQKEKTKRRTLKFREKGRRYVPDSYNAIKDFVWRHKRFCGCVDCGENNPIVLEYDHNGENHKADKVSRMIVDKIHFDVIKGEIRKCVVRCANCHRIKTAKERSWHREQIRKYTTVV